MVNRETCLRDRERSYIIFSYQFACGFISDISPISEPDVKCQVGIFPRYVATSEEQMTNSIVVVTCYAWLIGWGWLAYATQPLLPAVRFTEVINPQSSWGGMSSLLFQPSHALKLILGDDMVETAAEQVSFRQTVPKYLVSALLSIRRAFHESKRWNFFVRRRSRDGTSPYHPFLLTDTP